MLRLVRTDPGSHHAIWSIESPTPGVVLINLAIDGMSEPVPLHWRAGTWTKPPLDVELDARGRLVGLQFVLQDERVPVGEGSVLPERDTALPIFDVTAWPHDRYLDEKIPVVANRLRGGELALLIGDRLPLTKAIQIGSSLTLAFANSGRLAEIRLGPLSGDDWEAIDAFSTGD
jgi:hypothetical protein